ncbi:MAG TPA: TRAP transporter small permease [Rhodospirillales bacterium]|nr:TRAP transporter small permease [Rhodospirillales bacterium]
MSQPGAPGEPETFRVVTVATRMLGIFGAVLLFAMMTLTFVDVWGRYIFNFPIPGGFEITELMMATLIFAGLPLITRDDEHISVDLIDHFLSPGVLRWRDALVGVLSSVMVAVLSYRMWLKASEQVDYGDQTAALLIPVAPVTFFMAVTAGLTCLLLMIVTWAKFTNRHPPRTNSDGNF